MSCYWHHSCGIAAKLAVSRYFLQRMLFKTGIVGQAENKLSYLNLQGQRIYFNLSTPEIQFFQEVFLDKVYEQVEEFIPQKGWNVFDIGANVGLYALHISSRVDKGRIICFEPNNLVYRVLQKNIMANKISNIKAFPIAIGGHTGRTEFQMGTTSTGSGSIMNWRFKGINYNKINRIQVKVDTLNNFTKERGMFGPIDLMKMDIEGAEFEALCGADEVLPRTKRIVMEYHDVELLPKITKKLKEFGFDCIRLLPSPNQIAYFFK